MTARFVGNVFNEAIQDMQITVKKLPFLEVTAMLLPRLIHAYMNNSTLIIYFLDNTCSHPLFITALSDSLLLSIHPPFVWLPPLLSRWN